MNSVVQTKLRVECVLGTHVDRSIAVTKTIQNEYHYSLRYEQPLPGHPLNWADFYLTDFRRDVGQCIFVTTREEVQKGYKHFCCDSFLPHGVFGFLEKNGSGRKVIRSVFSICEAVPDVVAEHFAQYGAGYITGNYRVVACGDTIERARQLQDLWDEVNDNDRTIEYAEWCATQLT